MSARELAVGDVVRQRAGREIKFTLGLVATFAAFSWLCKETPSLELRQPWRDDPYDVLVSLDFALLPLLVGVAALRVQLCRRHDRLPARRLVDLLSICQIALWACLVTELGEWVAVALGLQQRSWTGATAWQIGALAGWTMATTALGVAVRRRERAVVQFTRPAAQPDWLADAVALGLFAAHRLGRWGEPARALTQWAERQLLSRVRDHPVIAALVLAGALATTPTSARRLCWRVIRPRSSCSPSRCRPPPSSR